MTTLFVNAAFRNGSRTLRLARCYLEGVPAGEVEEVDLGTSPVRPLDAAGLARYNEAVAARDFSSAMFDPARRFAAADEIVIAAPYWNDSIPAVLHDYLELVCTQGVSFDIEPDGTYVGLCRARRLVFVTTAGGPVPRHNFASAYLESLARDFWHIPEFACYEAQNLDQLGFDVGAELARVCGHIRDDRRLGSR